MFTNHKLTPEEIAVALDEMQAGFAASGKPGTFEENAVRVIGERLLRNPMQYTEFGPYWWAIKQVLTAAGYSFGSEGDALVAAEYRGATDAGTLVAGELFKDWYRATYFRGHCTWVLGDDGESYELFDADMAEKVADGRLRA